MENNIVLGDVVTLNSETNVLMTVTTIIDEEYVTCTWYSKTKEEYHKDDFKKVCLTKKS